MTPEELLLKAAEDISTHGHYKGGYSPDGVDMRTAPACAYGSLTRVATGRHTKYPDLNRSDKEDWTVHRPLIDQAAELLAETIDRDRLKNSYAFRVITSFNDADTTTAEDMILAMKRAANHGE